MIIAVKFGVMLSFTAIDGFVFFIFDGFWFKKRAFEHMGRRISDFGCR